MILTDYLTDIADAIRSAEKTSGTINATDFPERIAALSGGGGSDLPLTIHTGTFTVESDTSDTQVIYHGFDYAPLMVYINIDDVDKEVRTYSILGGICNSAYKANIRTNSQGVISMFINNNITVDEETIVFPSVGANYYFRKGWTYRWFAWGVNINMMNNTNGIQMIDAYSVM